MTVLAHTMHSAGCSLRVGGKQMRSVTTWLGIVGGFIMVLLMGRNYKGAIMIGILFVSENSLGAPEKQPKLPPQQQQRWRASHQVAWCCVAA